MFIEKIKMVYDPNVPIFTKEILKLFPEFSRSYIFKLIEKSEKKGELAKFSSGVYFIPTETVLGPSTIVADMVAEKKYVKDSNDVYGVYSGVTLLNKFSVTTQVPNVIEIVTNNETTRRREVDIDGRKFILRKSNFKINSKNYNTYTILQLFSDLKIGEKLNLFAKSSIVEYIKNNNITQRDLLSYAIYFPSRTINSLLRSEILSEID